MSYVNRVAAAVASPGREAWWVLRGSARLLWRYPKMSALLLTLVMFLWAAKQWNAMLAIGGAGLALTIWCRFLPRSFSKLISTPLWRRGRTRWLVKYWHGTATSCGLGMTKKTTRGFIEREEVRVDLVPRIKVLGWNGSQLLFRIRPLVGQTVDDVIEAGEQLRHALDAERIEVRPDGRFAVVTVSYGNALGTVFPAAVPELLSTARLDAVLMGVQSDGQPWWLPIGPHTLVAGCSGAGKGSLLWSFVFGLAPGIRSGHVKVYGIDLKGGMELAMGRSLFHEFATDPERAVDMMEEAAAVMRGRAQRLAGTTRIHQPTATDPFVVVIIDELAAVTAYITDRQLRLRGETALKLLCSQGRAVGFMVFACLQDPRKEVLPSRGLFTQTIGLRLREPAETTMVLGEGALMAGAKCHQIPRSLPGVGYITPGDGGPPINVRAGYVSDEAIKLAAARFSAPKPSMVAEPQPVETAE